MTDFETNPIGTMQELHRLMDERNALAAHVKRLTACANAVYAANNVGNVAGFDKLLEAVDDNPTTSHDRLKAEWQAEILQYLERKAADHRDPSYPVVPLTEVQRLLAEKRRQATGDE